MSSQCETSRYNKHPNGANFLNGIKQISDTTSLEKSIKIKATNIKQITTPTQGTLRYCISAAHHSPFD